MIEMDILEKTDLDEARYYDLNEHQLWVLYHIILWYNGYNFTLPGARYNIGGTKEPQLEEMFETMELIDWSNLHEKAHKELLRKELLREGYICRREVDWIPTEEGIQAIRGLFKQNDVCPFWAEGEGPWGDPNESLLHRKGVLTATHKFKMECTSEIVDWVVYPEFFDGSPSASPDAYFQFEEGVNDFQIEMVAEHNNRVLWDQKWESLSRNGRTTFWLFASRETMCAFFNRLDDTGEIELNGKQFSQPYKNWSSKAVNRKIWKSQNTPGGSLESQLTYTITGLLNSRIARVWEWRDEFLK